MAMGNCIQDLKENIPGSNIISNETATLSDVHEQISLRAVIHDDVGAIFLFYDPQERNDVGMVGNLVVQAHLRLLKLALALIQRETLGIKLVQYLDSILLAGQNICGQMNNTISAGADHTDKLEPLTDIKVLAFNGAWWRSDWRRRNLLVLRSMAAKIVAVAGWERLCVSICRWWGSLIRWNLNRSHMIYLWQVTMMGVIQVIIPRRRNPEWNGARGWLLDYGLLIFVESGGHPPWSVDMFELILHGLDVGSVRVQMRDPEDR
jgi:hypothetical protein